MGKPKHIKPGLYAIYFEMLKDIAKHYGYNLVVHGSMARDLDLIAIPWVDDPRPEQEMILDFQNYLTGKHEVRPTGEIHYTVMPGNRHAYSISLNRGTKKGEWVRFEDAEYYLDISVTQLNLKNKKDD